MQTCGPGNVALLLPQWLRAQNLLALTGLVALDGQSSRHSFLLALRFELPSMSHMPGTELFEVQGPYQIDTFRF